MNPAMNQLHFTLHRGNINATIKIHHPTRSTTSMTTNHLTSHPQVEILAPMEGLSKTSVSYPSIGLDWLSQSLLQTPQSLWLFLQVFHQTTHCILLRPFTSTSTQIRLNPISCLHQCRPPRTCSHQSSRWFERGMGSSYQACFESSRQDASCQRA